MLIGSDVPSIVPELTDLNGRIGTDAASNRQDTPCLPAAPGGLMVEIAAGELIDKLTILEIKLEMIEDAAKLVNVRREYEVLMRVFRSGIADGEALRDLTKQLKGVNATLWRIEDDIREHERASRFDESFVALARSVYRTNDLRSAIKRQINELLSSTIIEEKSYAAY